MRASSCSGLYNRSVLFLLLLFIGKIQPEVLNPPYFNLAESRNVSFVGRDSFMKNAQIYEFFTSRSLQHQHVVRM